MEGRLAPSEVTYLIKAKKLTTKLEDISCRWRHWSRTEACFVFLSSQSFSAQQNIFHPGSVLLSNVMFTPD